ncbi:FAD-binding monooxygenase domain protein [Mycobacterium kansasii]|uniref:FAD-binding monooxygenase domain protein n=1 Tax=Mycobacterium kansasii TaxID=1768 RepID=A0A1V3XSZ3_MYCKA|nr:FAD-binding monooxygenase domain protein [Mycobacterium kansasii]
MPVVHRHDERVAAHAEISAQRIIGSLVAENPTAAVEIDD